MVAFGSFFAGVMTRYERACLASFVALSEVLAAHPRGDLAPKFSAHLLEQAARKPGSHAERIVRGGVVERLAEHPLDRVGRRAPDRDGGATT